MGPATAPCSTRNRISSVSEGASAHRNDAMVNSVIDQMNSFTWPKVLVSQPVRGKEIALATPNDVMTQVPWSGETPRSPEIAGIDTFAMDVSSTFMNVASDNAIVPMVNAVPCNGCGCGGAIGMFSSAMLVSLFVCLFFGCFFFLLSLLLFSSWV